MEKKKVNKAYLVVSKLNNLEKFLSSTERSLKENNLSKLNLLTIESSSSYNKFCKESIYIKDDVLTKILNILQDEYDLQLNNLNEL
jgi:hypothetical protein